MKLNIAALLFLLMTCTTYAADKPKYLVDVQMYENDKMVASAQSFMEPDTSKDLIKMERVPYVSRVKLINGKKSQDAKDMESELFDRGYDVKVKLDGKSDSPKAEYVIQAKFLEKFYEDKDGDSHIRILPIVTTLDIKGEIAPKLNNWSEESLFKNKKTASTTSIKVRVSKAS